MKRRTEENQEQAGKDYCCQQSEIKRAHGSSCGLGHFRNK